MELLNANNLSMRFGGLVAINDFSMEIYQNEILGLIGPNGAGKTTVYNMLTGFLKPTSGNIFFKKEKITALKPYQIAKKGIVRTFQSLKTFSEISVIENMLISNHLSIKSSFIDIIIKKNKLQKEEKQATETSMEILKLFGLDKKSCEIASKLSYAEQRHLEIARALAAKPKLLLLDEPAAGMNQNESEYLLEKIYKIRNSGVAVMIIEHDMKVIMSISDRIIVLGNGKMLASGTPFEIRNNADVIKAYLGEKFGDA